MTKLTKAFREMSKAGLLARQNFQCCMGCGCNAMSQLAKEAKPKPLGYVFYHNQDNDHRRKNEPFYLCFGCFKGDDSVSFKVAEIVCNCLEAHDVDYEWDGHVETRIKILPDADAIDKETDKMLADALANVR